MAGVLDTLFKTVARDVVADLGTALDTTITYTRKTTPTYNVNTGAVSTTDTTYSSVKVPIAFVNSEEESGFQENTARIYITPNLIGDNQPSLQDEVTLAYAGANRVTKIQDIRTYRGGQEYLYILTVVF